MFGFRTNSCGSYSNRILLRSKYSAKMTSKPERSVIRSSFWNTCQLYRLVAFVLCMPIREPISLRISWCKQPQDRVCPLVSKSSTTETILPQSHWHTRKVRMFFELLASSTPSTTRRPKRWPVTSRRLDTPFAHPQDVVLPVRSEAPSAVVGVPHSQWQSQKCRRLIEWEYLTTLSLPNFWPDMSLILRLLMGLTTKFVSASTADPIRQPQLFERPLPLNKLAGITFSLLQVHLMSQQEPRFGSVRS